MTIKDLIFGDILTYRKGYQHCVNKPSHYEEYYKSDFIHISKRGLDIMKIQRYRKGIFGYKLETIYSRKKDNE